MFYISKNQLLFYLPLEFPSFSFCSEILMLDSALCLLVLGEVAKINLYCLKTLMDLVKGFISTSVCLQKEVKTVIIIQI